MTSIVFVHGTGVRNPPYSESFARVSREVIARRPNTTMVGCYWGDACGARLTCQGASIPDYSTTRSAIVEVDDTQEEVALWEMLRVDPLYELRVAGLSESGSAEFVPGVASPGTLLDQFVSRHEPSPALTADLGRGGIAEVYLEARDAVTSSEAYQTVIELAPAELDAHRGMIARAIVAEAIALAKPSGNLVEIDVDQPLRVAVVDRLTKEFGAGELGIGSWIRGHLAGIALRLVTDKLERERGSITDAAYPTPGDILRYQARGELMRAFIRGKVANLAPPVVLLAHSLGGIACVDLLVLEQLPQVSYLITVGSQAPFLYEIDALSSLPSGTPLPDHFPPWLNIFDRRDILSYIGGGVFPGKVEDFAAESGEAFPASHGAYWSNPAVWDAITARLQ